MQYFDTSSRFFLLIFMSNCLIYSDGEGKDQMDQKIIQNYIWVRLSPRIAKMSFIASRKRYKN
jgi:hypothetical protein